MQYTPNSNFTGEDTFNYQVFSKDGLQSEIATISLLVSKGKTQEKDHPPVAHDLIITTQVKQMVYIDTQSITFDQDGDIVETITAHDRGRAHFLTMNYGIVEGGSRWITYLPKSTGIEKIHYEAFNLSPQEKTKGKGIITIHVVNATKSTYSQRNQYGGFRAYLDRLPILERVNVIFLHVLFYLGVGLGSMFFYCFISKQNIPNSLFKVTSAGM